MEDFDYKKRVLDIKGFLDYFNYFYLGIPKDPEVLCRDISIITHRGIFRRDGVTPYIEHPKAIVQKLTDTLEKQVAWLHDVLEDTWVTVEILRELGVSEIVIEAVVAMSHQKGESYKSYLVRLSQNELAKRVKVKDILHNLSDEPTKKQIVKYAHALLFLMGEPL